MYHISKQFPFCAAHRLNGLPLEHQCSRLHGHNYVVQVVLESAVLDDTGFIRDYAELDTFGDYLKQTFDHRYLGYGKLHIMNEVGPASVIVPVVTFNPTAEQLAHYLYSKAVGLYPEVVNVGVSETPRTWAWAIDENPSIRGL